MFLMSRLLRLAYGIGDINFYASQTTSPSPSCFTGTMSQQKINLVWLKRDLRLRDHAALARLVQTDTPTLLVYCFEPSLERHPDYSLRHWRFVWESLQDLKLQLEDTAIELLIFRAEVLDVFSQLANFYHIQAILSHMEIGLKITFDRDKTVKKWCQSKKCVAELLRS